MKPNVDSPRAIVGVGIYHKKKIDKQRKDWQREIDLYEKSAQRIANVSPVETRTKPVVVHYMRNLSMGGTEKMCQLLLKYMDHSKFEHFVACLGYEGNERLPFFEEILGADHIIKISAAPEFSYILRDLKPDILERYSAGIPEWPMTEANRKLVKHFVSTSVFSQLDTTVDISGTIFVSEYNKWLAQSQDDDKCFVVNNPVEKISTEGSNLREELGIPEDAFVCGRIGRPDDSIFDPITISAFADLVKDGYKNLYYVVIAPPPALVEIVRVKNLTDNVKFIDPTTDEERINQFYRTIDIMAHSRKDGECNSAAMFEAMSCNTPILTHYSNMFNGQIDTVQNGGWVVLHNDVIEYKRILKDCVDGKFDLAWFGENARKQWERVAVPEEKAKLKEEIYERILNG